MAEGILRAVVEWGKHLQLLHAYTFIEAIAACTCTRNEIIFPTRTCQWKAHAHTTLSHQPHAKHANLTGLIGLILSSQPFLRSSCAQRQSCSNDCSSKNPSHRHRSCSRTDSAFRPGCPPLVFTAGKSSTRVSQAI